METRAVARYARISTRKARVVVNLVRGKSAGEALTMLEFTPKAAASFVMKLLQSAIANARQRTTKLDVDKLFIKTAFVDKGPLNKAQMFRWRPRAMGRATRIAKGLSHITLVLDEKE